MMIKVVKISKDGLAEVTFFQKHTGSVEAAKEVADNLLDKAGAVLNTRYKAMRAKEKAKAKKAGCI